MTETDTLATEEPAPLAEDELRLIDAYWRAANYLSVAQSRAPTRGRLRPPSVSVQGESTIGKTGRIDLSAIKARLEAGTGGYEVAHDRRASKLGIYVLVAPEPDQQQPHADDKVYVVLEGRGTLEIDGATVPLVEGWRSSSRPAPTTASSATRT